MEKYIVTRILRKVDNGEFIIDGQIKETRNDAKHHFHNVMTTYAYENNASYDYVSCEIRDLDGRIIMGPEVDNRIPEPVE